MTPATAAKGKPVPLTNKEFGEAVGIHHSMASRIRGGKRVPGTDAIQRISDAYGIPVATLMKARQKGPAAFGRLVSREIYAKGLRP